MPLYKNLNQSTPESTIFRGADTNREFKLGELDENIPTIEAEELIDTPDGSIIFRGADTNREMPLSEVAPHLIDMKAVELVDNPDGARVFRGADTRREVALENLAPNLIPSEEDENADGITLGEKTADTSVVFRGADIKREALLRTIADNLNWDEKQEDKYMKRVKAKALERVNMILAKAKARAEEIIQQAKDDTIDLRHEIDDRLEEAKQKCHDADNTVEDANTTLREAENIRANAYNEGYKDGLEKARLEAEEAKKLKSEAVGAIVLSIHGQCITIFNSWREDLTQLLYEAVEKSTNYVLDTEKKAILENLLSQSMNNLLDAREYTLRVNPDDIPMIEEIFEEHYKGQERRWTIKPDETLGSGGVIVESPSGLLKNTQEERARIVDAILENLSLPLSEGDQVAYDTITQVVIEESAKADIILNTTEKPPLEAEEIPVNAENENPKEIIAQEPPVENLAPVENKPEALEEAISEMADTMSNEAPDSMHSEPVVETKAENNTQEINLENQDIAENSPSLAQEAGQEPAQEIAQEIAQEAIMQEPPSQEEEGKAMQETSPRQPKKPLFKAQTKAEQEAAKAKAAEEMAKGKAFQAEQAKKAEAKKNEEKALEDLDNINIESEAKEMVDSGLNFDMSAEASLIEENELDAMEMAPPFEDKMKKLGEPQSEELENTEENKSQKEEIADEILDAMGFAK